MPGCHSLLPQFCCLNFEIFLILTTQSFVHRRAVFQVILDHNDSKLIHSCGGDRTVATTNIETERRIAYHDTPNSSAYWLVPLPLQHIIIPLALVSARILSWRSLPEPGTPVCCFTTLMRVTLLMAGRFGGGGGSIIVYNIIKMMSCTPPPHSALWNCPGWTRGGRPVPGDFMRCQPKVGHYPVFF